ncbi:MAG: hypothetical protein U1D55_03200 [Phycisphaerae bacterium]
MKRFSLLAGLAICVMSFPALAQDKKPEPAKPAEAKKPEAKPADAHKGGGEQASESRPKCAVMGDDEIDLSIFVETDDGPVFFCCGECPEKFKADPAKYAAKVEAQRAAMAKMPKVQVRCPASGKPCKSDSFVESGGKKIFFCCKDCPEMYKKEPAKFAKKLANAYTYQTKCPVTGKDIEPAAFVDLPSKQRIYFSGKECIAKFNADPAKYAEKLDEMGVHVDAEKIEKK